MAAPEHEALRAKDLLPEAHFVDAGYVDADLLVDTKVEQQVELVGPVRPDTSWQAKAGEGYDSSAFQIDWEARAVTCPQGQKGAGRGTRGHTDLTPSPPHGRLNRAVCQFANGVRCSPDLASGSSGVNSWRR